MDKVIMIAKDNPDVSRLIKLSLESEGYKTVTVDNGNDGLEVVKNCKVDMCISGISIPEIDGYELTKEIRKISNMPLLLLSRKKEESAKILGLNMGADDYITDPFNPIELVARVNALFRRYNHYNLNNGMLKLGDLSLDLNNYMVLKDKKEIFLTATEFKILRLFIENPNRIYSKMQICEYLNGEYFETDTNRIAVHIFNIREKIGLNPNNKQYIKNIKGLGYKIEEERIIFSA